MDLIIIKENFDLKRVLFRENKNSIKISYDINHVSMIGITFKINYETIIDRETYIIIKVSSPDRQLFFDIDNHFDSLIEDYDKFMINDNIKIKKHHEYGKPLKKSISITMNSIKKNISGRNKVQIFSI
tara:strand:+ start:661 stop:1044 length:384 start_codon:yes stop_codon:yes gene_type:complete